MVLHLHIQISKYLGLTCQFHHIYKSNLIHSEKTTEEVSSKMRRDLRFMLIVMVLKNKFMKKEFFKKNIGEKQIKMNSLINLKLKMKIIQRRKLKIKQILKIKLIKLQISKKIQILMKLNFQIQMISLKRKLLMKHKVLKI